MWYRSLSFCSTLVLVIVYLSTIHISTWRFLGGSSHFYHLLSSCCCCMAGGGMHPSLLPHCRLGSDQDRIRVTMISDQAYIHQVIITITKSHFGSLFPYPFFLNFPIEPSILSRSNDHSLLLSLFSLSRTLHNAHGDVHSPLCRFCSRL